MKADPCLNFRTCASLNWREDDAPQPTRCPHCGGPLLVPSPPSLVDRERQIRDLVWACQQGEDADGSLRRAIADLVAAEELDLRLPTDEEMTS